MKNIKLLLFIPIILLLASCSSSDSKSSEASNDATVDFAVKVDLFNAIEKLIKSISDKKYTEGYDGLAEIFKLTNEAGIVSDKSDSDKGADNYIQILNGLSKAIYEQANVQKINQVYFDYEKQELKIISSIGTGGTSGSESNSSSSGGSSSESSGSSSESSGSSSGSSSSSSESSSEDSKKTEEGQMIIPEEEILKKYPEIVISKTDVEILNDAVDLLNYVTAITLESSKENVTAITNREKYLLYKITALAKLDKFSLGTEKIVEAQNNWDLLYMKASEKNNKDMVTLSTTIKNISTALSNKNAVAIELQMENAIELLNTLSSKMKQKE